VPVLLKVMQAMISIKHAYADERFPYEHEGAATIQWMGVSDNYSRLRRGFRFFHLLSQVPMNSALSATTSSQFTNAVICLRQQLRSTKVAMVSIIVLIDSNMQFSNLIAKVNLR
jgi:hypothetical protein